MKATSDIRIEKDKLNEPVYDGRSPEWPLSIAQFKETKEMFKYDDHIDNNIRLNKALKGTARSLIGPLLIHQMNITQNMEDLKEHFGRPERKKI
uniref:Uncharacterized protein n=1 Tax=Megaselia scalaris TaxID=36166 RepID=T1GQF1_MEGSC